MFMWLFNMLLYRKKNFHPCICTPEPSFCGTCHIQLQGIVVCVQVLYCNDIYASWKCYLLQNCTAKMTGLWKIRIGGYYSKCTEFCIPIPKNSTTLPNSNENASTIKSPESFYSISCSLILWSLKSGGLKSGGLCSFAIGFTSNKTILIN